jgi:hypothetical protein
MVKGDNSSQDDPSAMDDKWTKYADDMVDYLEMVVLHVHHSRFLKRTSLESKRRAVASHESHNAVAFAFAVMNVDLEAFSHLMDCY